MPLLSWICLIDVHQNAVFEMGKNCWRGRVTDNCCKAKEGLDEFFRGNSRIISDGRVSSILKTLPGCRVYLDTQ